MRYTAKKIGPRRWRVFKGDCETTYTIERDKFGVFIHGFLTRFASVREALAWIAAGG